MVLGTTGRQRTCKHQRTCKEQELSGASFCNLDNRLCFLRVWEKEWLGIESVILEKGTLELLLLHWIDFFVFEREFYLTASRCHQNQC